MLVRLVEISCGHGRPRLTVHQTETTGRQRDFHENGANRPKKEWIGQTRHLPVAEIEDFSTATGFATLRSSKVVPTSATQNQEKGSVPHIDIFFDSAMFLPWRDNFELNTRGRFTM
jgi:hypothetical protein